MPRRRPLSSVRVRIVAIAAGVTAVAVAVAAVLLVRSVERSLTDEARRLGEARLARTVAFLASGGAVEQATSAAAAPDDAGVFLQIVSADGDVLAASPGVPFGDLPFSVRLPAPDTVVSSAALPGPGGGVRIFAASPLENVRRSVQAIERALWFVVPALVLLVAGLAWALTGRALRPVEAIRAEVEVISGSTMHRRVPEPTAHDEIGRLARTMNAMLGRLERASIRQREFVADASHELRSPVTTIRTELEVAVARGNDTDWQATAVRVLAAEARLEALIGDLLELARLDEGASTGGDDEAVDLVELARAHAGPAVDVSGNEPVILRGNRLQLERACTNLIDNARRHARARVAVTVEPGRLIVDDDGPGIPAADRERVFERFTRLEEARDRDHGGTGLGLALARGIATRHGGTIRAEDSPLGGARLVLELPA
jgi:signal transduction histidine kinase